MLLLTDSYIFIGSILKKQETITMQKELLKEYVKLETKFKELEEQKKALREEIVQAMRKEKMEKVETDFGSFTICYKSSYAYTDAIKKLEDKVKIAKIKEQEKGIAEKTTSEYLLFKAPKEII